MIFIKNYQKHYDVNFPQHKIDKRFLDALSYELPPYSGVAMGSRLINYALILEKNFKEMVSFLCDFC